MKRIVASTLALALASCSSAPASPPVATYQRAGEPLQVAVGGPMVDDRTTAVKVEPITNRARVDGLHVEIVYLGLLGPAPAGQDTIRVGYRESKIVDGVESEKPEYRSEVALDLARGRVIELRGWRIGVIDATASSIRYEVVGTPAR